jgi:flavin-dependent dehydrogenase
MTVSHYDVVIGGAGPAGCAAAIRLRQLNISVCLVDDAKDTVLKVGESLPGAAMRLLRRLGIPDLSALLATTAYKACTANKSAWGMEQWTYNDAIRNPETGGWHILRHKFDAALRQLAKDNGVVFYKGKIGKIIKNTALEATEDKNYTIGFKTKEAHLPSAISAKWWVDATGRSGALLKQNGISRVQFENQFSAMAWLHPDAAKNSDHTTRIKSVENGWWYSAKLPDASRIIAFYGLPDTVGRMVKSSSVFITAANKSGLLDDAITTSSILEGVVACNAATSLAKTVIGKSWMAIGDAALALDPISSQGIFFSLYSGIRGAETIAAVTKDGLQNAHALYRKKIEDVFLANQKSRRHFYTSELRYTTSAYWQQYFCEATVGP